MLFSTIVLAISSSIDSLGIGITYGIKNTVISNSGKVVIFLVSFVITIISLFFGNILKTIFPKFIVDYLRQFSFYCNGYIFLFSSIKKREKNY